jgi:hypothetical protein
MDSVLGRPIPTDLRELIYRLLTVPGPFDRLLPGAQIIICAYLNEKFKAAIAANPECEDVLQKLFAELTHVPNADRKD